jgi:hypothetical protein
MHETISELCGKTLLRCPAALRDPAGLRSLGTLGLFCHIWRDRDIRLVLVSGWLDYNNDHRELGDHISVGSEMTPSTVTIFQIMPGDNDAAV